MTQPGVQHASRRASRASPPAALLVGLALLLGTGCGLLSRPAAPTPTPTPSPTPTPAPVVAPTPTPVIATVPGTVTLLPDGRTQVEIDEATLTASLNRGGGLTLRDTPVGTATAHDFAVRLRDGRIRVDGTVQVAAASLPFSVVASASVQDGRPAVRVEEARVGALPLPEATRRSIEQTLQDRVDAAVEQRRVRVDSIVIADGVLRVVGRAA